MIDRLVIVDPMTEGRDGHYFNYTSSLVAAAADMGLDVVSLVREGCDFADEIRGRAVLLPRLRPLFGRNNLGYAEEWVAFNRLCARQLDRIGRTGIGPRDLLFFHSAFAAELHALATWHLRLPPPRPKLLANVHHPPEYNAPGANGPVARALLGYAAEPWKKVRGAWVSSTNAPLSEYLQSVMGIEVRTYPMVVPTDDLYRRPAASGPTPRLFFSGPVSEKGLEEMVRIARSRALERLGAELVMHIRHQEMFDRLKPNFTACGPKVRVIGGPLSRRDYVDCILAADAILLPYKPSAYAMRHSAMFVEALAAGRSVLTVKGTPFADELVSLGLPGVLAGSFTVESIFRAMQRLVAELPLRNRLAARVGPHYARTFRASEVLKRIVSDLSQADENEALPSS
jgi:glycosyltransferase involved in cell wall biosynthesis